MHYAKNMFNLKGTDRSDKDESNLVDVLQTFSFMESRSGWRRYLLQIYAPDLIVCVDIVAVTRKTHLTPQSQHAKGRKKKHL